MDEYQMALTRLIARPSWPSPPGLSLSGPPISSPKPQGNCAPARQTIPRLACGHGRELRIQLSIYLVVVGPVAADKLSPPIHPHAGTINSQVIQRV